MAQKIPQVPEEYSFIFNRLQNLGHSESQMISGYLYKVGAWDLKPDPLKAAELFVCASMTNPSDEIV